jgi:hypothetical protein
MDSHISPEKNWKILQLVFGEILKELDSHFSKLKIHFMPIKGAYLIAGGLSEKMSVRRMDDIDILVAQKDFERVCSYFSGLPNVRFLKHHWWFEKEFSYVWGTFPCQLEIHCLLNYPQRFLLPTEDLFARSTVLSGTSILLPCPEDALLILLCHVLVHIGFELRDTLWDEITLISDQSGFSWPRFWRLVQPTGIKRFIRLILYRYEKRTGRKTSVPTIGISTVCLQVFLNNSVLQRLPRIVRRAVLEIPCTRQPWRLIFMKRK